MDENKFSNHKVVKEWPGYFLRDDTEIRKNAGIEPHEAYSLFQTGEDYVRLGVYAGSKEWAIAQSEMCIAEREKPFKCPFNDWLTAHLAYHIDEDLTKGQLAIASWNAAVKKALSFVVVDGNPQLARNKIESLLYLPLARESE